MRWYQLLVEDFLDMTTGCENVGKNDILRYAGSSVYTQWPTVE